MTTVEVMILAVVQGVTEFVPVSSSGHLVLAREVFGIGDINGTAFDAFLHLGTLLAVLWYYRRTWWELGQAVLRPRQATAQQRLLLALLAVATVPAAVAGWGLHEVADQWRSTTVVGSGLLATAIFLLVSELRNSKVKSQNSKLAGFASHPPARPEDLRVYEPGSDRITWRAAIGVGLAQVLALFPGVSRSGSTIAAGQLLGLSRVEAVRFSFLLSAPIIAGAGLSNLSSVVGNGLSGMQLVVALVVAFGSGLIAIVGLTRWVERMSLVPFAIYLFGVGIVVLVL